MQLWSLIKAKKKNERESTTTRIKRYRGGHNMNWLSATKKHNWRSIYDVSTVHTSHINTWYINSWRWIITSTSRYNCTLHTNKFWSIGMACKRVFWIYVRKKYKCKYPFTSHANWPKFIGVEGTIIYILTRTRNNSPSRVNVSNVYMWSVNGTYIERQLFF